MIELKNFSVKIEQKIIVHNIDLQVRSQECHIVLGANGSGKSTLMKAISGLIPWSGEFLIDGHKISQSWSARKAARLGFIQVPEGRGTFPNLSVEENLKIGAYTAQLSRKKLQYRIEKYYDLFPKLQERKKQQAGSLSGGEQQILSICRALMAAPRLLMLDEPCLGLSPVARTEMLKKLKTFKVSNNLTFLINEQNVEFGSKIADVATILACGEVEKSGPAKEIFTKEFLLESIMAS